MGGFDSFKLRVAIQSYKYLFSLAIVTKADPFLVTSTVKFRFRFFPFRPWHILHRSTFLHHIINLAIPPKLHSSIPHGQTF